MDNKTTDLVNEVRKANNIVEVISSYLPLEKKGKNYFGVCPFHDDTNPSMSVSEDKQIYKCFSCGASGNVFNFVMDYEKVEFKEALNILAKRAGIALSGVNIKSNNKYEKYYKMYDLATKVYQNNLNSTLGEQAKEYLLKRGIDEQMIKMFKIGLSLKDRNYLSNILKQKNYTESELNNYGLGVDNHDLFIDRIIFPLPDISGKIVGFSGRIYRGTSSSKYLNTKETPIFTKGDVLFHYYDAKEHVREKKYVILVEGFMDVIRLASIGIYNTVALMGTAITKEHIKLLKRLTNNIYLSLDGDSAGQHADYVTGKLLEEENFNIFVVPLDNGLDPDEYIIKNGKDAYLSLVEHPISFADFKLSYLKEGRKLTSIDEQTNYLNEAVKEISAVKDPIKQELMLKKISFEFNIDIEILKNKLQNEAKCSKIETLNKTPRGKNKLDKYQKATYILLNAMMNNQSVARTYEKELNFLPYPEARYLANEIIYYYHINGRFNIADFITTLENKKDIKECLDETLNSNLDCSLDSESVTDCIAVIRGYQIKEEIKRLKKEMSEENDPAKKALISEKIRRLKIGVE